MNLYNEIKKQFPQMANCFPPKEMKAFLESDYNQLYLYHFGFGMWIRNNLLQDDSTLYDTFLTCGITQKDEMSSLMIQLFYVYLKPKYHKRFPK